MLQGLRNRGRHRAPGRFSLCLLGGVTAAALLTGCARSSVTSTVKPDGSWTRKVVYHGAPDDNGQPSIGIKLDEAFTLPGGAEWKIKREKTDSEAILTAERTMKPGETLKKDITLLAGKDKKDVVLVNEVSVKQIAPGRFEYRETLHWTGQKPKEMQTIPPDMLAQVKSALPPALATDANARELMPILVHEIWRVIFGPNEPLLSQMMLHPDLAEHTLSRRGGQAISHALEVKFGDKMTPEARLATTRKIVAALAATTSTMMNSKTNPQAPGGDKPDDQGGFTALTFAVKLPGKIVSTNGETDAINGEVYWALYAQSAALDDVVMTAVCDTNKTASAPLPASSVKTASYRH